MNKETEIKRVVEDYFGVKMKDRTRKRKYVEARAFYYRFTRMYTRLSLADIGDIVGRDHASVLNGLRRLDGWLTYDKRMISYYSELDRLVINVCKDIEDNYPFATSEQMFEDKYKNIKIRYKELLSRYNFLVEEIKNYDDSSYVGRSVSYGKKKLISVVNDMIEKEIEEVE